MPEFVSVRFRDCSCPGTPHSEGDIAQLRPYLNYEGGLEAVAAIRSIGTDENRAAQLLGPIYLHRGVVAWNLVDENGEPIPVSIEALDELPFQDAYALGNRADDLYSNQIFAPFLMPTNGSSKAGPTNGLTRPRSSGKRPRPSRRSSSPSSASGRKAT